jgi:hypothetical protein
MESKPRLVEVTDIMERDRLMKATGDLDCPFFSIRPDNRILADADELRAWRAAQSTSTGNDHG